MSVDPCQVCGSDASQPTTLVNRADGDTMRICRSCLEANMHLQAPLGEQALTQMFFERAAQQGLEAWQSDYVVYLLPHDIGADHVLAR